MKKTFARLELLVMIVTLLCPLRTVADTLSAGQYGWMERITPEHPRILFNSRDLPAIRARIAGPAKKDFDQLLKRVAAYPEKPELKWKEGALKLGSDGHYQFIPPHFLLANVLNIVGGDEALDCAFAYWVTGDKVYFEKAKALLMNCVKVFEWALEDQLQVEWEIHHYPNSFAAYDILYNELTPEERKTVLLSLMKTVRALLPEGTARFHRSIGGAHDGFYGATALPWYAGLAGWKDGIDDCGAEEMLKKGFDANIAMLSHRDSIAGNDGVLVSACMGYALGAYSYASFNFFRTLKAATGIEAHKQFTHIRNYPVFVSFNAIPGKGRLLEFGLGDAPHLDNALPDGLLYDSLRQIAHFYPEEQLVSAELIALLPKGVKRCNPLFGRLLPFVSDAVPPASARLPESKFRYMPSIGVAYMRSGNTQEDTFAVFRAGSRISAHQHYDEGHFTIYRSGFLALDSGTRGQTWSYHLPFYYAQSVAHNTLLIHMPEEPIASYWGPETRIPWTGPRPFMHGGQYRQQTAKAATGENPFFCWVVNDMTDCYRAEKCALVRREFIFFYPDIFLVIDKVDSVRPEYRKDWLIHSQNRPKISGNIYSFEEGGGQLVGQVLHPACSVTAVGGPGKAFWASGRNWELHPIYDRNYLNGLVGNWRIEISPVKSARFDLIVNLIQVGSVERLLPPLSVKQRSDGEKLILEFFHEGKEYEISIPECSEAGTVVLARGKDRIILTEKLFPPQ